MKNEISILISSGIELTLTTGALSINGEIETRLNTSRKINRSFDRPFDDDTLFNFSNEILQHMKAENDYYLQRLYDLKKEHSPYKNIVPLVSDKFETGAIIYDSWGWEQTNIDFYCIVKRSGQFVTILPMKKNVSAEIGFMTNDNTPKEIDFTAEPIKKKVKYYDGKESGFSIRDYAGGGWVSLYDGQAKRSSSYA